MTGGELSDRVLNRFRAELETLRRDFDARRRQKIAEFSSRGLGTSGAAYEAREALYIEQIEAEARMLLQVEVDAHRSERVGWTEQERDRLLQQLRGHIETVARQFSEEIQKISDARLGGSIGHRLADRMQGAARTFATRLVHEAENGISDMNYSFKEQLPSPSITIDEIQIATLPEVSRDDFRKAIDRLASDPSGAISAMCGAVDSATAEVYRIHTLGDWSNASFHERVKCSLRAADALDRVTHELSTLGWQQNDVDLAVKNLGGALNQAALFLQKVRPNMGDVHGSKPTSQAIALQALRWAMSIAAFLKPAS